MKKLLPITLLLAAFLLLLHEWAFLPAGTLKVVMLDVDQGDSILITTPGNQRILVDGGPNLEALERLGEELPFMSRRIDLLILSHPDSDHVTAFPQILERYDIKTILMTGVQHGSSRYKAFLDAAHAEGAEIILASSNNDLDLGHGLILDVLWPLEEMLNEKVKHPNNMSVVIKLIWKEHEILLTGDIEKEVEKALLASGADLQSDILKVAHHGSRTSSSTGFLLAANPDLAVMSVGRENKFGHPHPEIIKRYETLGIPIRRTDTEGRIEIILE
jgi:competence protein ComEC